MSSDNKKSYVDNWLNTISDKACKYPDNKYATVYTLRPNIYSIHVPCTHNMGDNWIHLVIGAEKAMLIDTGYGVGDLRKLVEHLANGKELIVVNTHCHGDHSLGNGQFDTVYIHEYDAPALEYQMRPDYFNEFNHVGEIGIENHYYDDNDIIPFRKYNIIPCANHTKFSLGNEHDIILIHMGGHCAGNSVFLDCKNRILFSGDAVMEKRNGAKGSKTEYSSEKYHFEQCTLSVYNKGLKDLASYESLFDEIFPAHGRLGFSKKLIDELIQMSDEALANPNAYDEMESVNGRNCCIIKHTNHSLFYRLETL